MAKVLGIDVGGTHIRYGIVEKKHVSSVEKLLTKNVDDFVRFVTNIVLHYPDIDVISIGLPGIVKDNRIISLPNLKKFEQHDMADQIELSTSKKVYIHKDVNLLFANDLERLNLQEEANVLGFYLGTGLGNAIKIDGKLRMGSNGFAGELGHIPVIGNLRPCSCGKIGCAETLVSGRVLQSLFVEEALSGDFKDIFTNHKDHPKLVAFIQNLAMLMSMEINALDILTLILGGGVINMVDFPKEDLRKIIINNLRSELLNDQLNMYFVDDSPIHSIIGAALLIKEKI